MNETILRLKHRKYQNFTNNDFYIFYHDYLQDHKKLKQFVKTLKNQVNHLKSQLGYLKKLAIIGIFGTKQKIKKFYEDY